jgi:RNA ligase (TIGR02306 family)
MTEFNPCVVRIENVVNHPNADVLDIATVLGDYPVIIKRGQYQIGDLVSYLPIDSVIDISRPIFSFLSKPRIKALRLRGIYSQGLLVDAPEGFKEGDSIVEYFDVKKFVYPEEVEDLMNLSDEEKKRYLFPDVDNKKPKVRANQAPAPKDLIIPYYDLDSLRKYNSLFEDGEEVVIEEKLEGCNFLATYHDGDLHVKSRNFFKKCEPEDQWWEAALRYNLKDLLAKYPSYGFFFELVGHVKPFFYDCDIVKSQVINKLYLFDIVDGLTGRFLDFEERNKIAADLGLDTAPLLYKGPWKADKSLYAIAEQDSALKSKHPNATRIAEGFVIRPIKEVVIHHVGRKVFKLKSERYNLFKK